MEGLYPATIAHYDAPSRTARIHLASLTDGTDGLLAHIAYPVGEQESDTERALHKGQRVWVFFENGDVSAPVIAFYRLGAGMTDTQRLRQTNIEILAKSQLKLAGDNIRLDGDDIAMRARHITIDGDVTITGRVRVMGGIHASDDIVAAHISLMRHTHPTYKEFLPTGAPL